MPQTNRGFAVRALGNHTTSTQQMGGDIYKCERRALLHVSCRLPQVPTKVWKENELEIQRSNIFRGCDNVDKDDKGPVLEIGFGPPTAESKNLKNHVNFGVGDLFFRSPALWSSQNVFGPPTASCVVVDFKDRVARGDPAKSIEAKLKSNEAKPSWTSTWPRWT